MKKFFLIGFLVITAALQAANWSFSGGYVYVAQHFIDGGYLTQDEIDACVRKLTGNPTPTATPSPPPEPFITYK